MQLWGTYANSSFQRLCSSALLYQWNPTFAFALSLGTALYCTMGRANQ